MWYIDFNAQGDKFVSCSDDLSIVVYGIDFDNEKPYEHGIKVLRYVKYAHERNVYSCCFSWDGKYDVSCSGDNSIMISEIKGDKMEVVQQIKDAHEDKVNCVCCHKKKIFCIM